jgi:peptide/nickel transport system permease protein
MSAGGQLPGVEQMDPDSIQVVAPDRVAARAFVGRSPGRLALMRLRRDRTAVAAFWVLIFFLLVAILAPVIEWLYGYPVAHGESALLDGQGFPLGYLGGITFSNDNASDHFHILGVEPLLGRDLFLQMIYGLQTSFKIAFSSTIISTITGVVVGLVSAYLGGWVDAVISWFTDYMLAFPFFLFCLAVIPVINTRIADPGGCGCEVSPFKRIVTIIIVFSFFGWMYTARLVRGQVLSLREREYVEAARAAGAPVRHILFRQLLPNLWAPILVSFSLGVPATITAEAALSFLNIGVIEPVPDLGRLINDGARYIGGPDPMHLVLPGLLIFILVLAFNLFGDALRDALDPKSSK